jgi:hypothetical protein
VGRNTFTIWAADAAGNVAVWRAALPAVYSGAFGFACLKNPCGGHQGTEGDPFNTASGNFVTRTLDLRLPGIGNTEIRVERTYNAQAVPPKEVTYTYDAADQLLQALRIGSQPNDRQAFVYACDASRNWVNLNGPGLPGPNTRGME